MGLAGFINSGITPALAGAYRGKNAASQRAEEQRRYDTEQAQQASEVKWRQQQALEAAQRQAMMDALAQQAQMASQKGGAESRRTQQDALAQQAAQADLNRKNALEIARLGATSRENVAGINVKGKLAAKDAGEAPADTLPASVATRLFENRRNLETIRAARSAIQGNPGAFGLQNLIPGYDYVDKPENIGARAPVANIGSLVIHDRSGAAVTISEYPRLRPFIPKANDRPEVAAQKLVELEREIASITDDMNAYYTQQGFAVPDGDGPPAGIAAPGPRAPARQGTGKPMSPAAYQAAKDAGYSDEEITAEGWTIP